MNLGKISVIQAFNVWITLLACENYGWKDWYINIFFVIMLVLFIIEVYITEDWVVSQRRNGKSGRNGYVEISYCQSVFPGGGGRGGK